MSGWQVQYRHLFGHLAPAAQRRVLASIQNGVIEGWEPTEDDVHRMVRLELGEITATDAITEIVGRADAHEIVR